MTATAFYGCSTCVEVSSYGYYSEQTATDGSEDVSSNFPTFDPNVVVQTEGLECAPETVSQVEPQSSKPYQVDDGYKQVSKGTVHQEVRIHLVFSLEVEELHVSPEVGQVETKNSENDDTQNEHVFGSP